MSPYEMCMKGWEKVATEERGRILRFLQQDSSFQPKMWDGKSWEELVELSYDNLPLDLQETLLLALTTEGGFSVRELRMAKKNVREAITHFSTPASAD